LLKKKKIRRQNGERLKQKEYPLILRNDVYDMRITNSKLSEYWIKVPVYGVKGGIKLPIKPHCEMS